MLADDEAARGDAADLVQTLPTAFRRRTIAVTLLSPHLGGHRNSDTRRSLTEQRRRLLGRLTSHGGAIAYSAPELLLGGPPSPAADMWAIGVVIFAMVFGRLPFVGATRIELQRCICEEEPDFPPAADCTVAQRRWRPLLTALLDKEPLQRPSASLLASCDM